MFKKNSHNLVTFVACCIPVLHKPLDVLSPNIHKYITKIISLATLYCNCFFFSQEILALGLLSITGQTLVISLRWVIGLMKFGLVLQPLSSLLGLFIYCKAPMTLQHTFQEHRKPNLPSSFMWLSPIRTLNVINFIIAWFVIYWLSSGCTIVRYNEKQK